MTERPKKQPYDERNDLEKLESQWKKLTGLHDRSDYSAAIIRCATAAEIAANIAVRNEFTSRGRFSEKQVDSFLRWANGLDGKMRHLILPLCFEGDGGNNVYKRLSQRANKISEHRNRIAHSGDFSGRDEARNVMKAAEEFVELLVGRYHLQYVVPSKVPAKVAIE